MPLLATTPVPVTVGVHAHGAPYMVGDPIVADGVPATVVARGVCKSGMTAFVIVYRNADGREAWAYVDHDGIGHLAGHKVRPSSEVED